MPEHIAGQADSTIPADSMRVLLARDSANEVAMRARYDSMMAGGMAASGPPSTGPLRLLFWGGIGLALLVILLGAFVLRRWREWRAR